MPPKMRRKEVVSVRLHSVGYSNSCLEKAGLFLEGLQVQLKLLVILLHILKLIMTTLPSILLEVRKTYLLFSLSVEIRGRMSMLRI